MSEKPRPARGGKGLDAVQEMISNRIHRFPEIPPDLDPLKADAQTLARYGLPPKPDSRTQPARHAFWLRLFSPPRRFVEADFLVPGTPLLVEPRNFLPMARSRHELSPTWSGAYITANNSKTFVEIYGEWRVPVASPPVSRPGATPADGDYHSSTWIGLDGQRRYLNSSLPQIGTEQVVSVTGGTPSAPSASAWFQWWTKDNTQPPVQLPLPVTPGDHVMAIVTVVGPTTARFMIKNQTTGDFSPPFLIDAPSPITKISGATAEWILERPSKFPTPVPYELPNYHTEHFHNCFAVAARSLSDPGEERGLVAARYINMFKTKTDPYRFVDISIARLRKSPYEVATFYR